jgi:hypothetical protein
LPITTALVRSSHCTGVRFCALAICAAEILRAAEVGSSALTWVKYGSLSESAVDGRIVTIFAKASWFWALLTNLANSSAVAGFLLFFGTSSPITDMLVVPSALAICGATPVARATAGAFWPTTLRKLGPDGKSATRPAE